jgi:hypothetical protein
LWGREHQEASVGYVVIGRNYDRDQPVKVLQDFEDTIFEQDRRVVESQRREKVPSTWPTSCT